MLNQAMSLDGATTLYANDFVKVYETGTSTIQQDFATKTELTNINTASSSNIQANSDAIDILNTKQLQNFNSINAITTDLTNNYQTNTVLAQNFYDKSQIDSIFSNYYTSTEIDTNLSTNYQNNTQIDANNWIDATALTPYALTSTLTANYYTIAQTQSLYYDKTYIDANIGGSGGYTNTEIDNLLDLRVPKSDFTDRFSANPIIDCSAPTVIHSGLTLNNETINISPTTGLLFSNQTGGGDKVVSVFKNATNYITLQGNKIISNATSGDGVVDLELNPSGNVNITNDLSLTNLTADTINLTIILILVVILN